MRIFNRTRDKLLRENRLADYLRYAIGEIVLVVIGILIALSINNWNLGRIENNRTSQLLESMVVDLEEDIKFYDKYSAYYEMQIQTARFILMDSIDPAFTADSIYTSLLIWTIDMQDNTLSFEKIKNASITNLLHSPKLDSAVSAYYIDGAHHANGVINWEVDQTNQIVSFWNNEIHMELPDAFTLQVDIPYFQSEAERKKEILRVVQSIEGKKHLRMAITNKKAIVEILQFRKLEAQKLIAIIQEHLGYVH